jgi:hypothetical protein
VNTNGKGTYGEEGGKKNKHHGHGREPVAERKLLERIDL